MLIASAACVDARSGDGGLGSDTVVLVLRRDSIVIDSLARLVNTDSLYRLYRAMLYSANPMVEYQEAICEEARILRRYGRRPGTLASERMSDTLWKPADIPLYNRIRDRMPRSHFFTISDSTCGPRGPRAPDSIGGVSLNYTPKVPSTRP